MRFKFITLAILMITSSFVFGQESLEDFYQAGKDKGILDMRPEVKINRVKLSKEGELFADSLEAAYLEATAIIPDMTKEGFLSNGVGRYLAKQELMKKIDVFEIEEIAEYKHSKNYDYSEFYVNIDSHIAEANLRASESLFFVINADCRSVSKNTDRFGNLECWKTNLDLYARKKEILDNVKNNF